jgi:hypothetical protein
MRTIAVIALIAMLPAAPALAQSKSAKKSEPAGKVQTDARVKECPEYGAGFMRVGGTGTCVKVGGYVRHETSRSR